MSSCLGLYVEKNIIKYAKISKEHENIKIEAFGIKFYEDNPEKIIEQIVKETFSFNTPISVNILNVKYKYSKMFKLLSKKDLAGAIKTDFDIFCNENSKNALATEYRTIASDDLEDLDKVSVLYAYTDKVNIAEKMQLMDGYKITNLSPVSLAIPNLLSNTTMDNNIAIVNIEANTEVTTLINGKVHFVDTIDMGMQQIIENIAIRENSRAKAYEICKNSTLYTAAGKDLQINDNEYIDEIMSNISMILDKVQEVINKNKIDIKNIYITGLGASINNIDLLFQERFLYQKCEILTPYFVEKTNLKLNIKDYIEVNSAIALSLQALRKQKGKY